MCDVLILCYLHLGTGNGSSNGLRPVPLRSAVQIQTQQMVDEVCLLMACSVFNKS